ncbi:MAG TPA: MMPL family transporter [Chitinophagaceae bacterium]
MWYKTGQLLVKFRLPLLVILVVATGVMGYFASKVQLSYEFTRAIPTDNPRYQEFEAFKKRFGDDGGTLAIGIESTTFYTPTVFNAAARLHQRLKSVKGVEDVLSIPETVMLVKDSAEKLVPEKIFAWPFRDQPSLDSARSNFENLPFYRGLLYNPETNAYITGVRVNKDTINSRSRTRLVAEVMDCVHAFENETGINARVSGLPFIRTEVGNRIKKEMNAFLIGSLLLSAITLLMFFRSFSAMLISLVVVLVGVVWSLGTIVLLGYKITLLIALIPPLVVVIGVPNCIYFLNKYHSAYRDTGNKNQALITMVGRMGVVTLFCNIAAAVGFAVFALTKSALLYEFGAVAGINIMALFFISLVFIPAVLSYLPEPKPKHTRYLDNKLLERFLLRIERWTIHHRKTVYVITTIVILAAVAGLFRLRSEGFIVDDLPHKDRIYTDLKWFESNFHGVMPLEIVVDTRKKNGVFASDMEVLLDIEEFSGIVNQMPETARPLSIVEGMKFFNQGFYDNDSSSYILPMAIPPSVRTIVRSGDTTRQSTGVEKLMSSFVGRDSFSAARISVNMKDIGSARLPVFLGRMRQVSDSVFDPAKYKVTFTGASVTFLEGLRFIISGLRDSIFWAFLLIAVCMLYLFRSFRILLCSLIPNVIPLLITAGLMGWAGIPLKPSTVLIFSIALGIAIDITIRFLVNYKQELALYNFNVQHTLVQTIRHTGLSIIYTSLVLIAGFVIFCFSDFGGTRALGWLTSLTLLVGTLTNLVLLPVLILSFSRERRNRPDGAHE